MTFHIERATERDVALIFRLIKELAEYERLADLVVTTEATLRESLFGAPDRIHEVLAQCGIRGQPRTSHKGIVILVELSFQNAKAVEFGKQKASRLADWAHRVIGMQLLPGCKIPLSAVKVKIVEPQKSAVEGRDRETLGQVPGSRVQAQSATDRQDCYYSPRSCI